MRPLLIIAVLLSLAAPQKVLALDEPQAMKPVIMRFLGAFAGERPDIAFKSCREFESRIIDCDYDVSSPQRTPGRLTVLLGAAGKIRGVIYSGPCEYDGAQDGSPMVEAIVAIGDHNKRTARSVLNRLRQMTYARGRIHGQATIGGIQFTLNVRDRECSLFAVRKDRRASSKVPT